MHGEQAHLARRARLERQVRAPAHVVLRQAERLDVVVAAISDSLPDREADVLHGAAFREAELAARKEFLGDVAAVDLLKRNDVGGQGRGEIADAREVLLAPAPLRREVAGDRALIAAGAAFAAEAGRRQRVKDLRRHHPLHVPGRERQALGGGSGGGVAECERGREEPLHFPAWRRFATRSATTAGSASVEVSPRCSCSFAAILRRIRRMILPERVFGSPGAHWM